MTLTPLQERLRRQLGAAIQELSVEFWLKTPNGQEVPVSVTIKFQNGPAFTISCAGDGGVAIRKGYQQSFTPTLELRSIGQLSREVMKSVEFGKNCLVLATEKHRIHIYNYDDQLKVTVNDYDVLEVMGDSA